MGDYKDIEINQKTATLFIRNQNQRHTTVNNIWLQNLT